MAGYAGFSMSNNAVEAYENDRLPLSKAVKAFQTLAGGKGRKITQKQSRGVLLQYYHGEWHHSSKYYNEVNFYDIHQTYIDWEAEGFKIPETETNKKLKIVYGRVDYIEWEGTRSRPKPVQCVYRGLITVCDKWLRFNGKRKSVTSNGTHFTMYKVPLVNV